MANCSCYTTSFDFKRNLRLICFNLTITFYFKVSHILLIFWNLIKLNFIRTLNDT